VIARAQEQDTQVIAWSATDIVGNPVKIPDGRRPTALVLLAADDAEQDAIVTELRGSIPADVDTQFVVIVSGPSASTRAMQLATTRPAITWPIIADANHAASEALGVRGWPIVLVLRPDGSEVARVTGKATFLAMKIPPYLSFAAGKIDAEALKHHLATHPIDEDDPVRKAERDIRLAHQLMDSGKAEQALELLSRNETGGDAIPIAVSEERSATKAEVLIQLNRPADALEILKTLPSGSRVNMLKAKSLLVQHLWDDAKALLIECVATTPDDAEAHQLLGSVYEHEGDFESATAQYRTASMLNGKRKGAQSPASP
jgi:tetratricopeptide (TPR) repeat protein